MSEYYQDIRYRILEFPHVPIPNSLLEALFDFGEQIHSIDKDVGAFMLSPTANASFLLTEICKIMKANDKSAVLNSIFDKRSTLRFCAEFWGWRTSELGLIDREGRSDEPTIGEPLLDELHKKLVARIEHAIEDGSIYHAPFYIDIVEAWAFGGNEAKVKAWISECSLYSGKFLAKIFHGLLGYTVGSNPRIYSMHSAPREKYYNAIQLRVASETHEDDASLTDDERSRIKTLRKGLARLLAAQAAAGEDSASSEQEDADGVDD